MVMSNKTSDENVASVEIVIKDCREHLKIYGEAFITASELDRIENVLAEREQKDERIKELEEELAEFNKQLDLDYVDENFIPRQVLKDEIDVHTNLIIAETGNPTLDAHFRDRENYVIDVLQKILKKGEK